MNDFWKGIKYQFNTCCIIFFCDFWCEVRKQELMFNGRNPDGWYNDQNKNRGYIRCPECMMEEMNFNEF